MEVFALSCWVLLLPDTVLIALLGLEWNCESNAIYWRMGCASIFSFGEVCGGGPWFGKCAGVALGGEEMCWVATWQSMWGNWGKGC